MAMTRNWVKTDAAITTIRRENAQNSDDIRSSRAGYIYRTEYEYTVDGITYRQFSKHISSEPVGRVGDCVRIVYDPEDPRNFKEISLEQVGSRSYIWYLLFFALAFLVWLQGMPH